MGFLTFDDGVWQRLLSLLGFDALSPMTLASGFFLIAFVVFMSGYMLVRRKANVRNIYVLLFSLYFSSIYCCYYSLPSATFLSVDVWHAARSRDDVAVDGWR